MQLYRLIKDNKVVGYMKLEGGKIYHTRLLATYGDGEDVSGWGDVLHMNYNETLKEHALYPTDTYTTAYHPFFIPHDRIDQYTGVDYPDGGKVFERDEGMVGGCDTPLVCGLENGSFIFMADNEGRTPGYVLNYLVHDNGNKYFKFTGIQGIK